MVKPDKSRYVWLYLPSKNDKERWQSLADRTKTPLSTWAIEIIESTLAENEEFRPRSELVREVEDLKKEIKTLNDDLRQKNIVLERYEADLKRYRSQAFLGEDYRGTRKYNKEIVDLLKERGQIDSYKLLDKLGIDPRESDLVKAVSNQLEELEAYGFVKSDGRSWKWIG